MTADTEKTKQKQSNTQPQRIGFLAGQLTLPDDFDIMASAEIEALFNGNAEKLLDEPQTKLNADR